MDNRCEYTNPAHQFAFWDVFEHHSDVYDTKDHMLKLFTESPHHPLVGAIGLSLFIGSPYSLRLSRRGIEESVSRQPRSLRQARRQPHTHGRDSKNVSSA